MRHLLANIITYSIAVLLFVGAALFAWMRSAQLALTNEAALLARYEPATAHDFEWRTLGASSYVRNCANCHGRQGEGWDQYPPLDHAASLLQQAGGREYLIDLHLHGLTSSRWGAPMPPMRHLRDVELAAVLNYIVVQFGEPGLDPSLLFDPSDIEPRREPRLSPRNVDRRRPDLD